jgi:hypothetical protein
LCSRRGCVRGLRFACTPSNQRAQGRPGAGWHPRSLCVKSAQGEPQVQPGHPGPPCANGFNGLFRAPRRRIRLATVIGELNGAVRSGWIRKHLRRLDTSNGCQDHTALPSATAPFVLRASIAHETSKSPPCDRSTRAALSRPPHPRPNVRDDRDTPLCAGRDGGNKQLIWGNHEADSFFARDWTAQISLKGLKKLDFSRRANCAGGREFYCWSAATKDGRSPSMPDAPRPGARQMFRKSIRQKIVGIAAGSRPSPGWLGLAALQEG